jgi:Icc protein
LIRQVFPEIASAQPLVNFSLAAGNWRLIGLDSHLPGHLAGRLDGEQRDWLARELRTHPDVPTVLFMHHPPFTVQSSWLDAIMLQDSTELIGLAESFPQVRAICTGHVHQQYEARHGKIRLLTTPSTSVQFQPRAETLIVDDLPPGFRVFRFDDDAFYSHVVRLHAAGC